MRRIIVFKEVNSHNVQNCHFSENFKVFLTIIVLHTKHTIFIIFFAYINFCIESFYQYIGHYCVKYVRD